MTSTTGILVRAAMMRDSSLPCSGSRCTITTKAAPTLSGKASKNDCKAVTPPADAPMLATGTRACSVWDIGVLQQKRTSPTHHRLSPEQEHLAASEPRDDFWGPGSTPLADVRRVASTA